MDDKAFTPGDLILQEEPWIHTISAGEVDRRCYYCLKWLSKLDRKTGVASQPMQNNRCSGCKLAKFCSKTCQVQDWKERHKLECGALGRITAKGFSPPEHFLLMLKIVAKLVNSKCNKTKFIGPVEGQRTFYDLIAHLDEIQKDQETIEYLFWMRSMIGVYLGLSSEQMEKVSAEEFLLIYGKVKCNTFVIEGTNWEQIGIGVYLQGSAFDHSCAANACQTFVGKRLSIRATTTIDSIKNVRVSYTDPFEPVRVRQEKLQKAYYFTCTCPLCSDSKKDAERFSLQCINPSCPAEIPSDERANQPCPKCDAKVPNVDGKIKNRAQEFNALYNKFIQYHRKWNHGMDTSKDDLEEMQFLEKELLALLHAKNPIWPGFYISKGFMLQGDGRSVVDFSWPKCFEKALELYRPWLSANDPRLGWCAYFAADPTSIDYLDTLKKMDESRQVLGSTFGPDHELTEAAEQIYSDLVVRLKGQIRGRR